MTDQNKQTARQILESTPSSVRETLDADLCDVAKWMKCKVQNLQLRKTEVPSAFFKDLVDGLILSYARFPGEKQRTLKILKQIERGQPLLPVFIEEGDQDNFVMEGRHRIVAFHLAGLPTVPVIFVSKMEKSLNLESPSP